MNKRWIGLIIIAVGLATVLAGCGSKGRTESVYHHASPVERRTGHRLNRGVDYHEPSEKRPYPKRFDAIVVSQARQRAYLLNGHRTVYTMYASTGSHHRTPDGHYRIQPERTAYFYSPKEHEGAQYGTSWKDHGVYLFHSTPSNRRKQVIKPVARDLGKRPSSHGCVHLTIPDAKYIMGHAKVGTKVIIKGQYR